MAFQKLTATLALDVSGGLPGPDVGAMGSPIPPAAADGATVIYATLTLLADGRVLFTGGLDAAFNVRSECFILDPVTGLITPTGSLPAAGYAGTAARLPNGKVLYTGGGDAAFAITKNVFLFDPAKGTWSTVAQMGTTRISHTLTVLNNGKVLAAGGRTGGGANATSCELFTIAAGTWAATGAMTHGRGMQYACKLTDGTVLVVGGNSTGTVAIATCEIYSPGPGTWADTGALNEPRASVFGAHYAATDAVLAAGGNDPLGVAKKSAEMYNFGTGLWTLVASMNQPRETDAIKSIGTDVMLADGRPMAVDMPNASPTLIAPLSCETYDVTNDVWTQTTFHTPAYLGLPLVCPLANGNMLVMPATLNDGATLVPDTFQIGPGRHGEVKLAHGLEDFNGNGLTPTDLAMRWATDPCDSARVVMGPADPTHVTVRFRDVINGAVGAARVWINHSEQEG